MDVEETEPYLIKFFYTDQNKKEIFGNYFHYEKLHCCFKPKLFFLPDLAEIENM